MKRLHNLSDLFEAQTKDIYDSAHQQMDALSKINENVHSPGLKKIISKHYDNSKVHKERLIKAFELTGIKPDKPKINSTVDSLVKKSFNRIKKSSRPSVKDASAIAAIQDLYHFDMAEYGTACAFAKKMGKDDVAEVLHQSLDEIKKNDRELSKYAEEKINGIAVA